MRTCVRGVFALLALALVSGCQAHASVKRKAETSTSGTTTVRVVQKSKAPASLPHDKPYIFWGESIGDVHLGMTEAAVVHRYGSPTKTKLRSPGVVFVTYVVHRGARLWVTYRNERVVGVETTSSYYQTPESEFGERDSIGWGSLVRDYSCSNPTYYGSCDAALLGFQWADDCESWVLWSKGVGNFVVLEPQVEIIDDEANGLPGPPKNRRPITGIGLGYRDFTYADECTVS
jgi:hypothetical protein